MLSHTRTLIEDGFVAIDSIRFQKLITSLHTAVDNERKLDKNTTSCKTNMLECLIRLAV
jgi:hypothetical protein